MKRLLFLIGIVFLVTACGTKKTKESPPTVSTIATGERELADPTPQSHIIYTSVADIGVVPEINAISRIEALSLTKDEREWIELQKKLSTVMLLQKIISNQKSDGS